MESTTELSETKESESQGSESTVELKAAKEMLLEDVTITKVEGGM